MYSWLTFNTESDQAESYNCGYYFIPRESWNIFSD